MFSLRLTMLTPFMRQSHERLIDSCHHCLRIMRNNCSKSSNKNEHSIQGSGDEYCENESLTSDDKNIEPDLRAMTENQRFPSLKTVSVIPGKGPPPEPPITCCMSGCANCVWILYAEELKAYYGDGGEKARKALDLIEDPSLKAFLKLELGL